MNSKPIIALLTLLLAACAQAPVKPTLAAKPAVEPAPQKVAQPEVKLPDLELTDRMLFEFMLAEIAGQRGSFGIAQEAYSDLAKKTRDPRVVSRALDISLYTGQLGEALAMAKLLLELDPGSIKATQTLAALLIKQGSLNDARPYLEKLLEGDDADRGPGMLQLASLLARVDDQAAALSLAQQLTKPYANQAEAHYAVAQLADRAGQKDLALKEAAKAMELRPEWEQAVLLRGKILMGESTQATLDFFKSYLKQHPASADVRLNYAKLLVSERKFAEARSEFERLRKDYPGNSDVLLAVALLSLQLGDSDQAVSSLEALLAQDYKDSDSIRYYLGQTFEARKDPATAAKWYLAVRRGPQYLPAQIRYASILAQSSGLQKARDYLHGINAKNDRQKIQLLQSEAQLLRDAGKFNEAYDLLDQALKQFAGSPELLYDHAMAAEKVGKIDVLERNLRDLIELQPDNAQAYNALGYSLLEYTDRIQEAQPLIEKALSLLPDDPFILDSMGWLKYRTGNLDQGVDYLKRAYSGQQDPEIAAHLGEVLWTQGKRDEAGALWQSALKKNPDNEALKKTIKKFAP